MSKSPLSVVFESVVVDDFCPVSQQCKGKGLVLGVLVVEFGKCGPQGARQGFLIPQLLVLDQEWHGVHSETVDSHVQPERDDILVS